MSERNMGNLMATCNEGCDEPRRTLADKVKVTGKMLEEALRITAEIKCVLYGATPMECKRPESDCLETELGLTENGMQSLLCELNEIRERMCWT